MSSLEAQKGMWAVVERLPTLILSVGVACLIIGALNWLRGENGNGYSFKDFKRNLEKFLLIVLRPFLKVKKV